MYLFLKYSLYWLFFFLPISASFLLWDKFSYFSWSYSPWSSFMINISDIFLIFSLFFYFLIIYQKQKLSWWFSIFKIFNNESYFFKRGLSINIIFVLLSIAMFVPIFFAKDFILHIVFYFKFISYLFLFLYLPEEVISKKEISNLLLFAFLFQWVIAVFQFYLQGSIGLSILGEPNIAKDVFWIAKIDLPSGEKIIRPYWTLLHSNILWISSVIAYFLSSFSSFAFMRYLLIVWIIISFSRTAWLLFFMIFLLEVIFRNKVAIRNSLIVTLISISTIIPFIVIRFNIFDSSFFDRIKLFMISSGMFLKYPFWVWLWNFTIYMQDFANTLLSPWEVQPVHNFFMLLTNEAGIISLTLFLLLFFFLFKHSKQNLFTKIILFFTILIVWSLDHFFLTSTIWMIFLFGLIRFI